jgi:hypothetical protein
MGFAQKTNVDADKLRTTELQKVDFLVGTWKGKGWILKGRERKNFTITETIQPKLNGEIIVVDGLGKSKDEKSGEEKIIHQAYGIFFYDKEIKKLKFRFYKADGAEGETTPEFSENRMVWQFDVPEYEVTTRFTEYINDKGNWLEIGEVTRDKGKTWFKFFEMELSKIAN